MPEDPSTYKSFRDTTRAITDKLVAVIENEPLQESSFALLTLAAACLALISTDDDPELFCTVFRERFIDLRNDPDCKAKRAKLIQDCADNDAAAEPEAI